MQRFAILLGLLIAVAICDTAGAYYHAQLGRFVSRDPIGYRGGMNLYTYVGAMPTRFVDPWGLVPVWAFLTDSEGNPVSTSQLPQKPATPQWVNLSGNVNYSHQIVNPDRYRWHLSASEANDTGPGFFADVHISYELPSSSPCQCSEYRFVQTYLDRLNPDAQWTIDGTSNAAGGNWGGGAPYWNNGGYTDDADGAPHTFGAPDSAATMYDQPGQNGLSYSAAFETCAVCTKGKEAGKILGCITWQMAGSSIIVTGHGPPSQDFQNLVKPHKLTPVQKK